MLREKVLEAISKGEPIYQSRSHINGDNLINWWTSYYALKKLIAEEGLACSPTLKTYPEDKKPPKGAVNLSSNKKSYWAMSEVTSLGIMGYRLGLIADNLGVTLTVDDLQKIPQPDTTDFRPLDKFDKDIVMVKRKHLRNKVQDDYSKIVVIAQSGSKAEKRFSDANVRSLAEGIKRTDPNAFVAVVSDKDILSNLIPTLWRRIKKSPKPFETNAFPYNSQTFRQELVNRDFGPRVNQAIFGFDINEFCAWFYAADMLVATDSYWSWLGCGTKSLRPNRQDKIIPDDAVILYTIANPDIWKVPNATLVESEGIRNKRIRDSNMFYFLDYDQYYAVKEWGQMTSWDPLRGIIDEDIDKVKDKITRML